MFAPYGYAVLRGGVCLANDKAKQELHWRPATPSYRLGLDRLAPDAIQEGGSVKRPDAVRRSSPSQEATAGEPKTS